LVTVFVDTSVLYAVLDADDPSHIASRDELARLKHARLVSHSYVVLESVTLVERRLGRAAARDLLEELVAQLQIVYVDDSIHGAAVSAYLSSAGPSLVDCTSFEVMRRAGIRTALAVDSDFRDAGFEVVPT
jgi:predicted nucleic acid-binding protein